MDEKIIELLIKFFPEEYDFIQDNNGELKGRRTVIHPMPY